MDVYSETIVKRKLTSSDRKKVKAIFASILIGSAIFMLAVPFYCLTHGIPLISALSLSLFLAYVLYIYYGVLRKMQLEFEYILTNSTFDFDKIIAQKKRVRLASIDVKSIEETGVYLPEKFKGRSFETVIHAEKNVESRENVFILLHHNELKRTLIVFTPDERMTENLKLVLPRNLIKDLPQ